MDFVVQTENVQGQRVKEPLGFYLDRTTQKETSEVHILFDKSKGSLRLNKELDLSLFDFHTLRHTHATLLLEAGASMVDIQHRLGHAKLSMSMRYVHDTTALQEQTKAILAGLYDENLQNSR